MYYYYGNDYMEAIANEPVKISKTKTLRQYEDCYNFIIPIDEVFENEDNFETKKELNEFIEENNLEDFFFYKDGKWWILYYNTKEEITNDY